MSAVVVGYTATAEGADALALGARLALVTGGRVEAVLVLPGDERGAADPSDSGYDRHLRDTAREWLRDGLAVLPAHVPAKGHVRYGESFAAGLVTAAAEFGAELIVVGAGGGGLRGRHRVGSVASELLHSSDVPVVLAPADAREVPVDAGLPRITAAIGTRPGADVLLEEAVSLAAASGAALRLVSLATIDLPAGADTGVIRLTGATHAEAVLEQARASLPPGVTASAVVATGDRIEDAVGELEWLPAELVMVGSSRLAQPRRLFLGSTASKMLRELPVPMVVVPRTRGGAGARA